MNADEIRDWTQRQTQARAAYNQHCAYLNRLCTRCGTRLHNGNRTCQTCHHTQETPDATRP